MMKSFAKNFMLLSFISGSFFSANIFAQTIDNTATTPPANTNTNITPQNPSPSSTANTTNTNPLQNCSNEGITFQNKEVIFNSDNNPILQRIFILQNIANYTVLLNHANKTLSATAGAGWSTKIDGGKYAALAMNQRQFAFNCIGYNPPKFGVIDCRSVISACAFPPQKTGVGSFWVAENMPLDKLIETMQQRNVLGK